ncbi:MAG TPA: hypothetical protein V6C89_15685 [Drouetiella sp.]
MKSENVRPTTTTQAKDKTHKAQIDLFVKLIVISYHSFFLSFFLSFFGPARFATIELLREKCNRCNREILIDSNRSGHSEGLKSRILSGQQSSLFCILIASIADENSGIIPVWSLDAWEEARAGS